ncbi:hypothetical protein [Pseudomonas nunensis]|uniref:Lipoprotein n=1 Tax=Pseudomonas nunensis TaxID=2961896 RepID=A0ABY5EBV7_9PSED|nr:hypothetical protein [Pseudomonas nunensis]MCL5229713.1 hypothetical protein [Pseudomonas nunensis]UTO11800.1 hypothetical protein NK667_16530 [Pseudomonas nunensis]
MKAWAIVTVALLMSGCANHPLDCATGLIAWDDCLPGTKGYVIRQESLKNLAAAEGQKANSDDAECQSFGAQPGTDTYVNCRIQLKKIASDQQTESAAQKQRAAQAFIMNMQQQQNLQNQQTQQTLQNLQQQKPAIQPQINCTSTKFGQTVNTSCH